MKKLYFLDENEKNRILNLHESATKRQYLREQESPSEWRPDPTGNKTWEYQFRDNSWIARKKGTTQEYNISKDKKYASSIGELNKAYPEAIKPVSTTTTTNTPPNIVVGGDASSEAIKKAAEANAPTNVAANNNTNNNTQQPASGANYAEVDGSEFS
jgi:hypothetical protein